MDRAGKPLFIKTYGKKKRRVAAWISPDNRKQAFDSTSCSAVDSSVFEPSIPAEIRTESTGRKGKRPPKRPAKRKAAVYLKEKENVYGPPPASDSPVVQRKKRTRRSNARLVLDTSESEVDSTSAPKRHKVSAKRKKRLSICIPSAGRFVTRRRANLRPSKASSSALNSSDDFAAGRESPRLHRILRPPRRLPSALQFSEAENFEPSDGATLSPVADLHKPEVSLVEAAECSLRPCPRQPLFCSTPSASLHKRPRPKTSTAATLLPSAASPHGPLSHLSIFSTSQEELDSPGDPLRAPNATPSALGEPQMEPSLKFIGECRDSLARKPQSRETEGSSSEQAKSQDEDTGVPDGVDIPSPAPSPAISSDPLRTSLAWEETNDASHFVSASAGREWLVEALKHICLTKPCSVQLVRVDKRIPALLHSPSSYSSCLDRSSSGYLPQTTSLMEESVEDSHSVDPPHSEENGETPLDPTQSSPAGDVTCEDLPSAGQSFQPDASAHGNGTAGFSQSGYSSTDRASAATDSHITNQFTHSQFTDGFQSADHKTCQEDSIDPSVVCIDSGHHIDDDEDDNAEDDDAEDDDAEGGGDEDNGDEDDSDGGECASGTQSPEDSRPVDETVFTGSSGEECAAKLRATPTEKVRLQKCTVRLQRVASSRLPATAPLEPEESSSGRSCGQTIEHKAKPPESNTATKTDPVEHKRSRRSTARRTTTVPSPTSLDQEGGAPEPAAMLTEACFTNTPDLTQCVGSGRPRRFSRRLSCLKGNPTAPVASDHRPTDPPNNPAKSKKLSKAPREKKKRERSLSKDRSGTARKACVSGLSVSRWKDRSGTGAHLFSKAGTRGASKTRDSFMDLFSVQHKPSEVFTESPLQASCVLFSTPARAQRLNLSSMLTDLTPDTHTWSRLKAALSVHRKTRVCVTPGGTLSSRPGSCRRAPFSDLSQDLFTTPGRTPLHSRFRSTLPSMSACEDEEDLSDGEKVYAECGQPGPLSWEVSILPHRLNRCVKIGEGTFGEVFSTTNASGETVALKIIPVEGSEKVNGEEQKTFGEILHEIIISKELSSLKNKTHNQTHGFIGLNGLHCVQGCYPPAMLDAWDAFDQKKGSENDRPDFFDEQQLFLIFEFEFGGSDLENSNGTLPSLSVAKSILHQVTAALAVAEQELRFEHRDLHWGNVLVKTTKVKKGTFLLNGINHSLDTKGVLVRIIDYSLSRLEIDGLTVSCDISADEELFMGQGDYQFDIYRLMRQANGNNWSDYRPHSNILWLHYLSGKLRSMKYRGTGGRGGKGVRDELTRFHDNLLQYSSATEALQNCPLFQ